MAERNKLLRGIPKVDEILTHPSLVLEGAGAPPSQVTQAARDVLAELREEILAGRRGDLPTLEEVAGRAAALVRKGKIPSLRRVINATGVILHTNLGRAPLPRQAVEAVAQVAAGYSTLEYQVDSGSRGSRHDHVAAPLTALTGAEDALVVNNNAAAVMLVLSTLARGMEVVVSRGELVEIGGAFRVPEVMEQSGCLLREVGATNRTRLGDYRRAVTPGQTGALLKVHTSNYKITGFTQETPLEELAELAEETGLPLLYDLGSGALLPLHRYGIHDEPCVADALAAGADIVCFSGDKLLGGPQAGIILGKKEHIARMKRNPLTRALRIDKLTLAALEATLRLYYDPERGPGQVPILAMLAMPPEELWERAQALADRIGGGRRVQIVEEPGQMGGGSLPAKSLPSLAVAVTTQSPSAAQLEARLRGCPVPIVARISQNRLLLDVRTIDPADLPYVADCVKNALETGVEQ